MSDHPVLIMFDVDGTLVHSDRRDSSCFAETYEHIYGVSFPTLDWRHFPHVTDHVIFGTCIQQHFQREYTAEEAQDFQQHYMELLRERRRCEPEVFCEVPGARRMIESLQERDDVVLSVATGGWRDPAHIKLNHIGIRADELPMVGGDYKETRDEILQEAITATGREAQDFSRIIYLGDAVWDVTTTHRLGFDFIGIRHRGDVEVLLNSGSQKVIQDYRNHEQFWQAIEEARPPIVTTSSSR